MTRSMRWMSSSAPSSLFASACTGLPQPRSRIAVAAETRAAGVASFARITPTSTLIAVLVWLRASERISVMVLAICKSRFHEADDFGVHDKISATTIATRPSSASEIKYAVMRSPLELNARQIAEGTRSFRARTLSSSEGRRRR
jgi:hypothetical protein